MGPKQAHRGKLVVCKGVCARSSCRAPKFDLRSASSLHFSWLTILKRREGFRAAFAGFEMAKVAEFGAADVDRLLVDEGIIRHRGKIEATVNNARIALELEGGLERFVLGFKPTENRRGLTKSPESEALSKALRKLGFNFVGPTTMHALMQATGMINDHDVDCFKNHSKPVRLRLTET